MVKSVGLFTFINFLTLNKKNIILVLHSSVCSLCHVCVCEKDEVFLFIIYFILNYCYIYETLFTIYFSKVSFESLDPESMNTTTMKYAKSVMQLEKGLPPNAVVPKLKEKVELMRERVFIDSVTIYRNKWEREGIYRFCYYL